jgi:spermidine/putrescine transport system permease protein
MFFDATLIGTISALGLHSYRFKGRKVFSSIVYVLAISPDIIMGISLLILFNLINLNLGFYSLLLAHITLNLPFVIIIVIARLKTFNKNLQSFYTTLHNYTNFNTTLQKLYPTR